MKGRRKARKRKRAEVGKADMVELMRDIGSISLGLVSLSRENASDMAERLVAATNASKAEGKKMEKKLKDMAEKGQRKLYSVVKKETKAALKELNVVTRDDLKDLERRMTRRR